MQSFFSGVMSIVMFILAFLIPGSAEPASVDSPDVLFTAELLSDTHLGAFFGFQKKYLRTGLSNISASGDLVDAVVFMGDITNSGKTGDYDAFFGALRDCCSVPNTIVAAGNHDIAHVTGLSHSEARERFLGFLNDYSGAAHEKIYYSYEANGYTFIVLGDDGDRDFNRPFISDEQIAFLDTELAKATVDGKPAFVCCHWPLMYTNGQEKLWKNGCVQPAESDKIKAVLEKYDNVFYLSGHTHPGFIGPDEAEKKGYASVETKNGVTYVCLPTFGQINRHRIMLPGTGMQMEIYADKVVFKGRNFLRGQWYDDIRFDIELKSEPDSLDVAA